MAKESSRELRAGSAQQVIAQAATLSKYRRWLVALCAGSGLALGAMDTGVNVALPAMTTDFDTDMQTIQWIIVSHVAARAGLSVSAGSSGDLFGLKRVFLVGAALNTIALLAVGLTPDLYAIFGLQGDAGDRDGNIAGGIAGSGSAGVPAATAGRSHGDCVLQPSAGAAGGDAGSGGAG